VTGGLHFDNTTRQIRGIVLDMDGVLWRGDTALPGLSGLFDVLADLRLPYVLATNSAARRPSDYRRKLEGFGVEVDEGRIVTSAVAAAADLASRLPAGSPVYVIGESGLREALASHGLVIRNDAHEAVAAVVVGFDSAFSYAKLRDASLLVRRGAEFVATNLDDVFPAEGELLPGAGALVAAVSAATGRRPRVTGKPGLPMFARALEVLSVEPAECVMVGDRLDTDIAGGAGAGMFTVLVTTGVDSRKTVAGATIRPDLIVDGLPALANWLRSPV
jgi:4-nitrophenyl phosphatase